MQLVGSEFLTDACGLSRGLAILALLVGIVWWLFGWSSHRFWVVMLATVLAGIYGLAQAQSLGAPPLLTAVLLAISAGVLALSLVRAAGFLATGITTFLLTQALWPTLHQPVLAFLIGGLLGLSLFRPCMMAITSLAGAILMNFSILMLLNASQVIDAPVWAEKSTGLLNGIVIGVSIFGFIFQLLFYRYVSPGSKAEGADWKFLFNWILDAFRWIFRSQSEPG